MHDIDTYIGQFPENVQEILKNIRRLINDNAPGADEFLSYGMPAYNMHKKPLIYFAAFKNHIGLYATPSGHRAFEKEFAKYKHGKGSVQFPLDRPMPYQLIEKIIRFRVKENAGNAMRPAKRAKR